MKLKVCGLSKSEDVKTCVFNKVNFCGFILNFPKSHRFISLEDAKVLTSLRKQETKFVGVLVRPDESELEIFSKLNLDYFQLYGNYDNEELLDIKKKYKKKIIMTIQVNNKKDVENYKKIEKGSDIILWDSSGYQESLSWDFNWIKTVSTKKEKMIAGNITMEKLSNLTNLADIIDVSGALETNKVKDTNKIKKFINKIEQLNNEN
mgnify:CR=1 FL=1|tara:strand:- start:214 stop:831 length:618 start_codon:yes stop_codon:yes gene_type:complete